jgi:hypothetical protein
MSRRALRLTAIAAGMAGVGLVAGAAIAAPEQMVPLARTLGTVALEGTGAAWDATATRVSALPALATEWSALALGDRSPRRLAMLVASALALGFGVAALVTRRRTATSPRTAQPARGAHQRRNRASSTGVRLPATAVLPVGTAPMRRRRESDMPREVQALAAEGVSLTDIARRTGLPLDAVSLLVALAPEARQAPPSAA